MGEISEKDEDNCDLLQFLLVGRKDVLEFLTKIPPISIREMASFIQNNNRIKLLEVFKILPR